MPKLPRDAPTASRATTWARRRRLMARACLRSIPLCRARLLPVRVRPVRRSIEGFLGRKADEEAGLHRLGRPHARSSFSARLPPNPFTSLAGELVLSSSPDIASQARSSTTSCCICTTARADSWPKRRADDSPASVSVSRQGCSFSFVRLLHPDWQSGADESAQGR